MLTRRRLTALTPFVRRRPARRTPTSSVNAPTRFDPPFAHRQIRPRRFTLRLTEVHGELNRLASVKRLAAVSQSTPTPGGGAAPPCLPHRLSSCFPRARVLQLYPARRPTRIPTGLVAPSPPVPTAHIWPNDRRRKRSRPGVPRIRPARGLPWYTGPAQPLQTALYRPARRRPAPQPIARHAAPPRLAAIISDLRSDLVLLARARPRRRPAARRPRIRLGDRLAPFRCRDAAMSAGMFFRVGPAAATFVHNTNAGATVQQGAATFVRSGPAAAKWFRSRC